jgi:S-ribosylhomocysteine lyase LuxS involved in autoinducer biosynthesis
MANSTGFCYVLLAIAQDLFMRNGPQRRILFGAMGQKTGFFLSIMGNSTGLFRAMGHSAKQITTEQNCTTIF